jgi:hypothetical protein
MPLESGAEPFPLCGGKHDETQVPLAFGGTLIGARDRYGSGLANSDQDPIACKELGLLRWLLSRLSALPVLSVRLRGE